MWLYVRSYEGCHHHYINAIITYIYIYIYSDDIYISSRTLIMDLNIISYGDIWASSDFLNWSFYAAEWLYNMYKKTKILFEFTLFFFLKSTFTYKVKYIYTALLIIGLMSLRKFHLYQFCQEQWTKIHTDLSEKLVDGVQKRLAEFS